MGEFIMRQVFIVVGNSKSRKSSTIRALTGAGHPKVLQVRQNNGDILDIYIHPASLQEDKKTPEEFIQKVNESYHAANVLVALRLNASNNGNFPNALGYINRFLEDWNVFRIVLLGLGELRLTHELQPGFFHIQNPQDLPANEIAHVIRDRWGWR
jgi:hypothetical protein